MGSDKMRSVGVLTLGCKVNTYESEFIINELKKAGYVIKNFDDICDVYIINTCTVTNQSDSKSRKMIRQAIKRNSNACVVAMGCFIAANQDIEIEGLDIILGNKDKANIVSLLDEYFSKKEVLKKQYTGRLKEFEDMYINEFPGRTRAFVKIQDGCDNFCSYCIIPFVRGRVRSKDFDVAVNEINTLANNGYKEVVLTGIHTGAYGEDKDYDLTDLMREISKNENLLRIRISSIEITQLDEKFMNEFKTNKKICSHIHVPVQCPNDEILKGMNRKYTLDEYKTKIKELRDARKDVNITTDLIVGFPGETEEIFNSMLDECVNIGFSKIHTFPYSIRKGTKASIMKQVKDSDKTDRVDKMLRLSDMLENKYYNEYIGKNVNVLVEKNNTGFTSNYIKVHIDKDVEEGSLCDVKITKVDGIKVFGELISVNK